MKTPVIVAKEYIVYLEFSFNMTFIHCDCFGWSKEIKQSLTADFEKLLQIHRLPIFAIHEIHDNKHLKFLKIMGFVYYNSFVGADGQERQLFVRNQNGN